jgi:hypothetical protein
MIMQVSEIYTYEVRRSALHVARGQVRARPSESDRRGGTGRGWKRCLTRAGDGEVASR